MQKQTSNQVTAPQKPRNRILALTVGAFALSCAVGGVYVVRQRQIGARYIHLRQQGTTALQTGNNQLATADLGAYLGRYPHDPVALSAYARARLAARSGGGTSDAIAALRNVLKEDPSRVADGQLLLGLYLQTGSFNEALETADSIIAHAGENAAVVGERVQALMGLQRYDEAQEAAHRWVALAPDDLDAQMSVLTIMRQQQQPPANISAAGDALFKKHPNDVHALFLRGYAHQLADDPAAAVSDFKAVAAKLPLNDLHFAQLLVAQLDQQGLFDLSLSVLVRSHVANDSQQSLDLLARRYWDAGKLTELTDLLAKAPPAQVQSSPQLQALQALALIQSKRSADAAGIVQTLRARSDDPWSKAWAMVLNQVSATESGSAADAQKVVDTCNPLLAQSPDHPYLMFFVGDAYSRLGENELAVSSWERSAQQERAWALPLIRASEVLADEGRSAAALAAANEAVRRSPHSAEAVITLARVWATGLDKGQYGKADQLLELVTQIQAQIPNEEQTLPIRIDLLARSGKVDQAKALLNKALGGATPLSEATLLRLAALSDSWSMDLRNECFQRIQNQNGMTPTLAYAQALSLDSAGKPEAGLELLKQARASADPSGTSLDWRLTQARYLDQISSPQALPELAALGNAYPNDGRVQRVLLASNAAWRDRDLMDQTISRFRKLSGERGAQWRIARGRWLLTFSTKPADTQEAISLLTAAVQLSPDLTEPHVLLARAQERAGKLDLALDQLTIASNLEPTSDAISLSMVRLLQAQGNFEAARDRLERVVAGPMRDNQQRQQAALLLAQEGEFQQAIDLLRDSVDQSGASDDTYLLLAQLYRHSHEPAKAQAIAQKLMEKPDAAIVQFAADLVASQGRLGEAREILQRLDKLKLEPGRRELILADFAARYQSPADAQAEFQAAVHAAPKNEAAWKALIAWRVGSGDLAAGRRDLDQALQQLPDSTAFKSLASHWNDVDGVATAPELRPAAVSFVRDPRENTAADDMLRAAALSRQNKEIPQRLTDRMMAVARKYPQDPSVQIILAELCLRTDRLQDAIAAAHRGSELAPASPQAFQLLAQGDMAAYRWSEALDAANQWKDRAVGSMLGPDLAIATCDIELGQPAAALTQLQPYESDPSSDSYYKALPTFARAKELVQKSSAVALMEPMLKQGADGRGQWITFAVNNLPDAEAAVWLDRVAPLIPDRADDEKLMLANAWMRLYTQTHDHAYGQKCKALLDRLIAQPQPNPQALMLAAMLQEQYANPVAAEAIYRRLLAIQPDSTIAENNLAMILCRRGQNLDEAAALCGAALKAHPDIPALYDTAAAVQLAQKHYADALGNQESAVQMQPANLVYKVHLAMCLADAGRSARAGEVLKDLEDHRDDLERLPSEDQAQLHALRKQLGDKEPGAASTEHS